MSSWAPLPEYNPDAPRGTVYLLCFDRPFHHAKHYIGWTDNLNARLRRHRQGNGSKLIAAAKAAGIGFTLARTWDNVTRHEERRLKNYGSACRHCPRCNAAVAAKLERAAA